MSTNNIDNIARTLGSQSCNTISVNGNTLTSQGGLITLPNYPNSGEGAFYTAGSNISIDANNVISGNYQVADTLNDGLMHYDDKIKLDGIESGANNYTLPNATNIALGGIKVGTNLSIDEGGILSSTDTTYSNATQSIDGLMSSTDKTKFDNLSAVNIPITDVGNYYVGTNTESTFQEIGNKLTTLYDDLPPSPFVVRTGGSIPSLVTFIGNIRQYTFAINNEAFGTTEVTHLYKNGTPLYPHIHWATNGLNTTSRAVKWELEYSLANMNGTFTTPTIIVVEEIINANLASLTHKMSNFPTISGTNVAIGTYVSWRIRRITATGAAPSSEPFGLAFGIHVEQSVLK